MPRPRGHNKGLLMNSLPRWRWVVKEGKKEGAPGGRREDKGIQGRRVDGTISCRAQPGTAPSQVNRCTALGDASRRAMMQTRGRENERNPGREGAIRWAGCRGTGNEQAAKRPWSLRRPVTYGKRWLWKQVGTWRAVPYDTVHDVKR